jgi:hypothetical protein
MKVSQGEDEMQRGIQRSELVRRNIRRGERGVTTKEKQR